jgi:4-amino-4-deoxy-L-arabinose transferase-like glycosyltransferase
MDDGKRPLTHKRTALLLAMLAVVLLTATAPDIGLTWDEPAYIAASESYAAWLGELVTHPGYALSAEGIRYYWTPNNEHPPLDKVWSGLIWSVARHIFDDLTAHRLGNILLVGALVAMVYLMVATQHGPTAGLAAAGTLFTMPRFFFHAHLAALDVPAAFAVFAVVFFFWYTKDRPGPRWDIGLGLVWGLALATKINAVFVPPTLLLWILIFQHRSYLLRRLVLMGLIGAPFSLMLWPWLYYEPVERLLEYLGFVTIHHWEIGQWYLGRFYMPPPWHFPFVITFAVVPLTLTILYIIGIARVVRGKRTLALGWLFILCALVPMLALTTGRSMVYDNDRLFMPSFPYLAALAGLGFDWLTRGLWQVIHRVARPVWERPLAWAVAGIVFAPHIVHALGLYPHLLSYYSESIGGLPGATRLQLETTYWCETYFEAFPYLNAYAQPRDIIWVQGWSYDVLLYYQLQGKLRRDLRVAWPLGAQTVFERTGIRGHRASIWEADFVVLQYRQTGFDSTIRDWLRDRPKPVYQLSHQGIPLLEIYARASPDA